MDLIEEYKRIHKEKPTYGAGDDKIEIILKEFFKIFSKQVSSVLDFGCGKSLLIDKLFPDAKKYRYDPAIKEYEVAFWVGSEQYNFDVILCNDVLEHIPEKDLPQIFHDLSELSNDTVFTIHCGKAKTLLSDGSNAHITIKNADWWIKTLLKYWQGVYIIKQFGPKIILHCERPRIN